MSFSPMPVEQHAFEKICTYLMSHVASKRTDHKVTYQILGGRGQQQWGLDVVTNHPKFAGLVGQCKHKQPGSKLTFSEVRQELKKSDGYERPIERFFFLTNSDRDSQLQTKLVGYEHTRLDGTTFPVQLVYWADLRDLSFIPKDELHRLFPEQAYHARHFLPPKNMEAVATAYDIAPQVIRDWFSETEIHDIEFSPTKLSLPPKLWQKISLFFQAVDSAQLLRMGVSTHAARPCVRQLFRALPAIEGFAYVLLDYKKAYADLDGIESRDWQVLERCKEVQHLANSVAANYWSLCNGDMELDCELSSLNPVQA